MLSYAIGFAAGNFIGSYIEELLAIGDVSIQVILEKGTQFDDLIRKWGFGVTCIECTGKEGQKDMFFIEAYRRRLPNLIKDIKQIHPDAFIAITDTRKSFNGYFSTKPYIKTPSNSFFGRIVYIFSGIFNR
jgi:uncharacterized protein YebE (UPF0316 family)